MAVTRGQHLIGKMLGSCVLEKLLGYGGSSAVFLAQDITANRKVAVKVFLPRAGMDSRMQREFYRRFLHEARSASLLNHPNIVPIYSYGEQDGLPYIVMPYMPGGTLAEYIRRRQQFSLVEVAWYLQQLTSALDYAHQQGCIHCDVKPANILIDSEGHVLLSAFGIARLLQNEVPKNDPDVDTADAVMGTPDYISPEQALGRALDGRSDVYSLGITIFFLLAKELPFRADTAIALALLHVHQPPPALSLIRADVTPSLDHVIHKALAKNPDERFQSAGAFQTAFSTALQNQSLRLSKPGTLSEGSIDTQAVQEPKVAIPVLPELAKPVVQIKQLQRIGINRSRFFMLVTLVILLVLILTLSIKYATAGMSQASDHQIGTPSATQAHTGADLFTNTDNWPSSDTFFYNKQEKRYHIINKSTSSGLLAPYYGHQFRNFRLSITMTEIKKARNKSSYYGVIFRSAEDESRFYLFEIAPGDNCRYVFLRHDDQWATIIDGYAPSLKQQVGSSNSLTIEARANVFAFTLNGKKVVTSITDPSNQPLTSGLVGLYVESQDVEIAFSQLYIDPLK